MQTATATTIVDNTNTAKAVGSGNLDVFGTPMMIALMEKAAAKAMEHLLDTDQSSVGTMVHIEHLSATPLTATVEALATITNIDGNKVDFAISAKDNSSEIGRGTHTRFIVNIDKFMERTTNKLC